VYINLIGEYYLIDGHKFGCAFLAYDSDPDVHHASHLIFTGEDSDNHVSRLSGIAKKIALKAEFDIDGKITTRTVDKLNTRKQ
jgi:hypothetical protein